MSKVLKLQGVLQFEDAPVKIPPLPVRKGERDVREGAEGRPPQQAISEAAPEERLREAELQAQQMVASAQAEAERLLAEATAEAERIRAEAKLAGHEEGFAAGFASGREQAHAEYQQRLQDAEEIVRAAQAHQRQLLLSLAGPVERTAAAFAEAVLKRELVLQPADLRSMVMDMLESARDAQMVEVHVHPSDFTTASEARPAWQSARFGRCEVAVLPDEQVQPGGCVLQFDSGRTDATVETKLEMLREILAEYAERSVIEYVDANLG